MLTVLKEVERPSKYVRKFLCRCDCGNEKEVLRSALVNNGTAVTQSCGCLHKRRIIETKTTHGCGSREKRTSEYISWSGMFTRCYNPKNKRFSNYGGRGITVCDRWTKSFENFILDMGKKPTPQHSIDRIDVNGNYEPSNCKWATQKEQLRNTTKNVRFEYNGVNMIKKDWCDFFKVSECTINSHLNRGKTFEEVYLFYEKKNKLV